MLRVATDDDAFVDGLRKDWTAVSLSAPDAAMLAYVDKLTRSCSAVGQNDVEALRDAGFDDQAVLQINLIASFFNYINRVADGVGVGRA